jgi:hypothetical protein
MAGLSYYYWKNGRIRPSFFYNLPKGEFAIIRAFFELEIEEENELLKTMNRG